MSTVLAIDTASPEMAVAFDDGGGVRTAARRGGTDQSRLLLPLIDELLGSPRPALGGVVVVTGPGSYAGVRVGVATATALAKAAGCTLAGVPTLEAVAAAAGPGSWRVIHPAGRGTFAVAEANEGKVAGDLTAAKGDALGGAQVAGEGAAAFGGREISAEERVRAALELGRGRLAPPAGAPGVVYLREPNITVARGRAVG